MSRSAQVQLKSRRERSVLVHGVYNSPHDTFCGRIHLMRTQVAAYSEPVPPGCRGVLERDGIAATIAARWPSEPSCAWHEFHLWAVKTQPSTPCAICGGPVQDRGPQHELCRLRKQSGLPTPKIGKETPCPCRRCSPNGTL